MIVSGPNKYQKEKMFMYFTKGLIRSLYFYTFTAKLLELIPLDDKERTTILLLWNNSRPIHQSLGFHPREHKGSF